MQAINWSDKLHGSNRRLRESQSTSNQFSLIKLLMSKQRFGQANPLGRRGARTWISKLLARAAGSGRRLCICIRPLWCAPSLCNRLGASPTGSAPIEFLTSFSNANRLRLLELARAQTH